MNALPPAPPARFELAFLVAIFCLATFLRFFNLQHFSLWLDEFTSIQVATHSLSEILGGRAFNNHTPPLYYLALHLWFNLWGVSEQTLRAFSAICDLGALVLFVSVLSFYFSRRVCLLLALLYAVSPFLLYYAREGRMYSLALAEVILCWLAMIRIAQQDKARLFWQLILFFAATLGLYTHYYFTFALCSLALGKIVDLWQHQERTAFQQKTFSILIPLFLAGFCFLPWVGVLLHLAGHESQDFRRFVFTTVPYTAVRFLTGYAIMPLNVGAKDNIVATFLAAAPVIIPILLAATPGILLGLTSARRSELRYGIAAGLLGPLLIALTLSQFKPMLSERYLIVSYPFFLALFAFALQSLEHNAKTQHLLALLSLAAMLPGTIAYFFNKNFSYEHWRQAIHQTQKSPAKSGVLAVSPQYFDGLVKYYSTDTPSPVTVIRVANAPEEIKQLTKFGDFWLVQRADEAPLTQKLERLGFKNTAEFFYKFENGVRAQYFLHQDPPQ